jgi:hypothetical protein
MKKIGLFLFLVVFFMSSVAWVYANGYQNPNSQNNTITVPLPPSQAGRFHFNPDSQIAQGNYTYGLVNVAHIFDLFFVSLPKNVNPVKAIFDAVSQDGVYLYHSELTSPPFYATWHQSFDPLLRITQIHYILFFKDGTKVEKTVPLERDYRYNFVPVP